jgi:hypothetical protein
MRLTRLAWVLALLLWAPPCVRADVAVLLEEPYSYDGALAGTGHTAIYLTRVCAEKIGKLLEAAFSEESDEVAMRRKAAADSVEALP